MTVKPKRLFNSSASQIADNDDWQTNSTATVSELTAAFSVTGAFPLTGDNLSACVLVNLVGGSYTAQFSGVSGGTGNGLAEIYIVP